MMIFGKKKKEARDPFIPGIYHYDIHPEGVDWKSRVHLRVEDDLNGILWLNGNSSFYLNESASYFVWCLMQGYSEEEILKMVRKRYPGSAAEEDFRAFAPKIREVLAGTRSAYGLWQDSETGSITPFSKKSNAPFRMDLALTYACNNHCLHCYNEPGRDRLHADAEQWLRILDKVAEIGIPHVVFTGGEPTLLPFLPELIRHADELGIVSGLNTNGRRLKDPVFARSLAEAGLDHVQITLESTDAAVHDAMVNTPGAWEETVSGIRSAVESGLFVNTNTTLLKNNASVEAVTELVDFVHQLGVPTIGLNALIYSGKGKTVDTGVAPEQLTEVLKAAKAAIIKNRQRLLWYTPTQYCVFDPKELHLGYKACSAARFSMCVEPDGTVLPCQSWYQGVGNILTDDWASIWNAPLCLWLRNKEYMPEPCRSCEDAEVCSCGCPLEIEGAAERVSPRCGIPDCF